jgi:RNA polymerase sigma-70 factor (ECF subfamily)
MATALSPLAHPTYAGAMQQPTAADDEVTLARRITLASPARDSAAEELFCRRFAPRIRLFGLKRLRSDAAAADLVQDVLILVLDKLRAGEVREPGQIASFVFGTARQLVIDSRRNDVRRTRLLDTFGLDLEPVSESASHAFDADRLQHCLRLLAERERAVLVMTFYDDRPADELGTQLGLSAANVRVIRHRGIQRLRDCVQGRKEAR